jgi:hypothetical protein
MRARERESRLAGVQLFSACSSKELGDVRRLGTELCVPAGSVLAREGASVREFVVLLSGSVVDGRGSTPGGATWFGEDVLLSGRRWDQTIVVSSEARVLVFDARSFSTMLDRVPSVARWLLGDALTRLAEGEPRPARVRAMRLRPASA